MPTFEKRAKIYQTFFDKKVNLTILEYLDSCSSDAIIIIDLNEGVFNFVHSVNGKYISLDMAGASYSKLFEFSLKYAINPEDTASFSDLMDPETMLEKLHNSKTKNFRFAHFRYKLQNGGYRWVEQCLVTGKENGLDEGVVKLYVFDIHHLINRGIENGESNDFFYNKNRLTNLYNEQAFVQHAEMIVKENNFIKWCVLSIDIQHFKLFDDWYGRQTGDYLLQQIGTVLLENKKINGGLAGYLGQDDFAVLLPYDNSLINKIFEDIRAIVVSFGLSFGFMPAIGVCIIDEHINIADAIDRASIAASKAKNDIKNPIYIYNHEVHAKEENNYRVLADFMKALKNDEITFYLQPQCRISTGKIVGAEALARWIKKDGKIIPPLEFVPILEQFGFIADLDQHLWEKVCIWLRELLDRGHKSVPISLNVSRADIYTIDVPDVLENLIKKYNIPPELLKIEITESAYTETEETIDALVERLHRIGFLVLMDDFGSGYSSLNALNSTKMDVIKLDARFLNISKAAGNKAIHIIESVVNMTKIIGTPIIVEGVETVEQSNFLESLGCRYVQGFYFYKPMPYRDFENIILDEENVDRRGFIVKANDNFRLREFLDKNVYSDTMLNNIIGAVAFYLWHGDDVDIVRFNQQFYESVDTPDFFDKIASIQRVVPEEDKPKLYASLNEAMNNKLNGSATRVRFYKLNGVLTVYMMKFYYLGEKDNGHLFYGSALNITDSANLEERLGLIADFSDDSFVLASLVDNKWNFFVATKTLAEYLELNEQEVKYGFTAEKFYQSLADQESIDLLKAGADRMRNKEKYFSFVIKRKDKNGNIMYRNYEHIYVGDKANNTAYVIKIKKI